MERWGLINRNGEIFEIFEIFDKHNLGGGVFTIVYVCKLYVFFGHGAMGKWEDEPAGSPERPGSKFKMFHHAVVGSLDRNDLHSWIQDPAAITSP